jgi:LysR family hydrogen peroxide-inducible transcriptional activator
MEGGSIETLKRMIRKVSGYTLVPELSYQEQDAPNVIRFADPQPVREISLVVHKYFSREELLTKLVKSIRDNLPSSMLNNDPAHTVRWR